MKEQQQKKSLSLAKESSLTHNQNRIKIGKLEENPTVKVLLVSSKKPRNNNKKLFLSSYIKMQTLLVLICSNFFYSWKRSNTGAIEEGFAKENLCYPKNGILFSPLIFLSHVVFNMNKSLY